MRAETHLRSCCKAPIIFVEIKKYIYFNKHICDWFRDRRTDRRCEANRRVLVTFCLGRRVKLIVFHL